MNKFEELGVNVELAKGITDMGWNEPTPIQIETVPAGIDGRDIIAQAQTGTGKTGAYATIVLARIRATSRKPCALILAPTRELASQIDAEIQKLSKYTRHSSMAVYGGASIEAQIKNIRKGKDVIVGTPGRLKDLLQRNVLDISHATEVVFDEADRMLDMGFSDDLNFIMNHVPKDRQTLLFSATMAREIKDLAQRYLRNPMEISVSKDEICSDLTEQSYISVSKGSKTMILDSIISQGPKTIVFCQTKRMVDHLLKDISKDYKAAAIHGDIQQSKREKVIRNFKNDDIRVLIATDVAARGIDVNNIECVVNYDLPVDAETYLHRIGRTGRAGNKGVAVTFVTRQEERLIKMYERHAGKPINRVRPEELVFDGKAIERPVAVEPVKVEKTFIPKVVPKVAETTLKGMVPLQINIGKSDKFDRTQISGYVMKNANLERDLVGRVGLGSTSSYVEVHCEHVNATIDVLTGRTLNGKIITVQIAPKKTSYKDKSRVSRKSGSRPNRMG